MTETELLTYLTDATEPPPCLGDAVVLRTRQGGADVEAFSPAGRLIGRVPPAERAALGDYLADGHSLPGRVTALVPRPNHAGTGRVHVTLFAA
jgi:hypothetical protein